MPQKDDYKCNVWIPLNPVLRILENEKNKFAQSGDADTEFALMKIIKKVNSMPWTESVNESAKERAEDYFKRKKGYLK